jgi:hypothetical protein
MIRALLLATLVAVVTLRSVNAQEVPSIVRMSLDTLTRECRGADGKPRAEAKPLTSVDLNGDGVLDWVLDAGDLDCDNGTFFCGTGGCLLMIFISHGAGHTLVWEDNVHAWRTSLVNGRPGLRFDLHGSACGRTGADPCSKRYYFQGSRLILVR